MSEDKKIEIVKLAVSLYPCPPYNGKIIPMTIMERHGLICAIYRFDVIAYEDISKWRNRISDIIDFYFYIYPY